MGNDGDPHLGHNVPCGAPRFFRSDVVIGVTRQ
jgi:hypothetical protein